MRWLLFLLLLRQWSTCVTFFIWWRWQTLTGTCASPLFPANAFLQWIYCRSLPLTSCVSIHEDFPFTRPCTTRLPLGIHRRCIVDATGLELHDKTVINLWIKWRRLSISHWAQGFKKQGKSLNSNVSLTHMLFFYHQQWSFLCCWCDPKLSLLLIA